MQKSLAPVAVAAAIAAITVATGSDAKTKPAPKPELRVTQVVTDLVSVPPNGGPVHVVAKCPKGYVVTGGGILNGALEFAYADTTTTGQGYEVSYFNPSSTDSFDGGTEAICAKGRGSLRVKAARSASERKKAEDDMRRRLGR